ncbi:hypothetical protein MKS88_001323 [Plasmodium brasilianum]|uniref:Uncharacterized protein n=1 Tax=Plasmodium brasilianum TaxID=5824 RepID=A0ACB9YCG3_PLABR|nr:hypothetical protein MKS88_001323 [Plasmodium brasilianum]
MWNIFANEDLSLHIEKKEEENFAKNKIGKRKMFEKVSHKNILTKSGSHGSAFSQYDSKIMNKSLDMKIKELRKSFRKKYRIVRTQLLKLVKILKQFPEIESTNGLEVGNNDHIEGCDSNNIEKQSGNNNTEEGVNSKLEVKGRNSIDGKGSNSVEGNGSNNVEGNGSNNVEGNGSNNVEGNGSNNVEGNGSNNVEGNGSNNVEEKSSNPVDGKGRNKKATVSIELIKKLNKIIGKIDIEQLKWKKRTKKKKHKYRNEEESFKNNGREMSFSTKSFVVPQKNNDTYRRNVKNIMKKSYARRSLLLSSTNYMKKFSQKNLYENAGLVYSNNNIRNNYYMNHQNKKQMNSNFYNDTDNVLVTDFYMYSTLNASYNRLNSVKKRKVLQMLKGNMNNSAGSNNIDNNNYNTCRYKNYGNQCKNFRKKGSIITGSNNLENNIHSNNFRNISYAYNYNGGMLNYLPQYMPNITEGLHFEARLGDKKLTKLKLEGYGKYSSEFLLLLFQVTVASQAVIVR